MEQNKIYPDFSLWDKNAIKTDSGIIFAPEDFCVIDEYDRWKSYFTWDEAIELERTVLRPAGWRIPSLEEWRLAVAEYGKSKMIRSALHLECNGFVSSDLMADYNLHPSVEHISHADRMGFYWSSTTRGETVVYRLYLGKTNVRTSCNFVRSFGYNVRCVKSL